METRVMITGGSGFLGAHLAQYLANRGDKVLIYDLVPPREERAWLIDGVKEKVDFVKGSVEDLPSIISPIRGHRIEKIIHLASIADIPYLKQNPLVALRINVGGTINVLEAAKLEHLERIVYASTNGVLSAKRYEPIDEDHPVLLPEGPATGFYGASKVSCEAFGMSYWMYQGVNFIALRPSSFYGFGMQIPLYIKPIIEYSVRGLEVKLTQGKDTPRDYVYIKDVVSAFVKALDVDNKQLKDRIFMIATGGPLHTPGEAAAIVREILPASQIEFGETVPDRDEFKHRGVISIERAKKQLGYTPQYDFCAGIEDYINMYREFLRARQGPK